MALNDEVDALRRISRHEYFGQPDLRGCLRESLSINLRDNALYIEIDFYSDRLPDGIWDFDVDDYDRERLRVMATPANRITYDHCYSLSRALLGGQVIELKDGVKLSKQSFLECRHGKNDYPIYYVSFPEGD